jgi:DNA helicase TIP49 (TBP-interacting protein)
VLKLVSKRRADNRSVKDALLNFQWLSDLRGSISVRYITELLELCEILDGKVLQQGVQDQHVCKAKCFWCIFDQICIQSHVSR